MYKSDRNLAILLDLFPDDIVNYASFMKAKYTIIIMPNGIHNYCSHFTNGELSLKEKYGEISAINRTIQNTTQVQCSL